MPGYAPDKFLGEGVVFDYIFYGSSIQRMQVFLYNTHKYLHNRHKLTGCFFNSHLPYYQLQCATVSQYDL